MADIHILHVVITIIQSYTYTETNSSSLKITGRWNSFWGPVNAQSVLLLVSGYALKLWSFDVGNPRHKRSSSGWLLNQPMRENIRQNGFVFPKVRDENKKYLKPPPSLGFACLMLGKSSKNMIPKMVWWKMVIFIPWDRIRQQSHHHQVISDPGTTHLPGIFRVSNSAKQHRRIGVQSGQKILESFPMPSMGLAYFPTFGWFLWWM